MKVRYVTFKTLKRRRARMSHVCVKCHHGRSMRPFWHSFGNASRWCANPARSRRFWQFLSSPFAPCRTPIKRRVNMCQLHLINRRISSLHRAKKSVGRTLSIVSLTLCMVGNATAQHSDKACASYASSCQGRLASPLCVQLQKRCGATAGGAASIQSPDNHAQGMPDLDHPTEMPDCPAGQEMVMVPTCQCSTPFNAGDAPTDNGACASCTADGVRMECQAKQ
jgi:hypothetical protein